MDDFNNLKKAWVDFSDVSTSKKFTKEELNKIVKQDSNNELQKIKRKLLLEWGLAIVISLLMVVIVGLKKSSDIIYALLFVMIILGVSFVPYYNVFRFRIHQNNDLKTHLTNYIGAFNQLVAQYIRMSTILIPVSGLGGFLLGFHSSVESQVWVSLFTIKNILILVCSVAAISFVGGWVQRRYFTWIYGSNIKRLQKCLDDLDDEVD